MGPQDPHVVVDLDRPNPARIYDYLLGGSQNFAVDRDGAEQLLTVFPQVRELAVANRAFLGRAVRWCITAGYDQFLDLGSGVVPTVGNVHEIAHGLDSAARVAYVDIEPVAITHATQLLDHEPRVSVTHADLRDPDSVLAAPEVAGLLDFTRPIALLAVAVLHYVPGDAAGLLARYRRHLPPGSAIVLSHNSDDHDDPLLREQMRAAAAVYRQGRSPTEFVLRTRAQLHALLADTELVPPGLVDVVDWPHPQPELARTGNYGAPRPTPSPVPHLTVRPAGLPADPRPSVGGLELHGRRVRRAWRRRP